MTLLSISGLEVSYGAVCALRDVTLSVGQGEIVALIGPNGAGKTSLLMAVAGIVKPSAGRIDFGGTELRDKQPEAIVAAGIAQVPESRDVFTKLTVHENLLIGASLRGDRAAIQADIERIEALFPRLAERRKQPAGLLSGGEQQMLAIGRAMMSRPRLLMLDEPSLGLAPVVTDAVFETIAGLQASGTTILLVEQNSERALSICHRAYLISAGVMVAGGTPDEIHAAGTVDAAYFGLMSTATGTQPLS